MILRPDRCPRCGSGDVMGKKFGFGDCSIVERACRACGLFEDKNNRDDDYGRWLARWEEPEKPQKRTPEQPKPKKTKKVAPRPRARVRAKAPAVAAPVDPPVVPPREMPPGPCWATPGAHGTHYHPGPLALRPRLAWSTAVRTAAGSGPLVASRFGVAWARGHGEQSTLFDPDTGRGIRWFDEGGYSASIREKRVAFSCTDKLSLEVYDFDSKETIEQRSISPSEHTESWRVSIGDVVLDDDAGGYVWALGHGVVEARRFEPRGSRVVWRRELPVSRCFVHGDLVIAYGFHGYPAPGTFALDRATGETRWEAPAGVTYAIDDAGIFVREYAAPKESTFVLRRRNGEIVWRLPSLTPCAYGPEVLIAATSQDGRRGIHVLDRITGEERTRIDVAPPGLGAMALVADAILHWPEYGVLRACDWEGRERWRLTLDRHSTPGSGPIAITPGRIFVASADHLVCIEDSP